VQRVLLRRFVEATLFQDADRPGIVNSDPRVERTNGLEREKLRERLRRDALAPVLATHPVGDEALAVLFPTADVPNDRAANDDGSRDVLGTKNVCMPVSEECLAFPRRGGGHALRDRVSLVLEEDREVFLCDLAQDFQETLLLVPRTGIEPVTRGFSVFRANLPSPDYARERHLRKGALPAGCRVNRWST
jgi:hypothetical protein